MLVTILFENNRLRPQRFSLLFSSVCFFVKSFCCCPVEIFQASDVHTGAVCLPLITDLFMKQGLGKHSLFKQMIKTLQEISVSLRLGNSMFHISISFSLRTFCSATRAGGMDYLLSGLNVSSGYKTGAGSPGDTSRIRPIFPQGRTLRIVALFSPYFSLVISGQTESK